MAAYDLEEQEQLAEIKTWWKQYGNLVTSIVIAASLGILAWQGWNWYERKQAGEASGLYSVLQRAALERDTQKTKAAAGELVEKFGRTTYASLGALTAAKALYEAGDIKSARTAGVGCRERRGRTARSRSSASRSRTTGRKAL